MNKSKKAERTKKVIGICLDCFIEKGLMVTTTTDLCNANNLQNGGIYYYFDTKEKIVLACAEEAISRIEQGAFSIALEDIKDVANMMNHLGTLADELSPVMRFLVSVCVAGIRKQSQAIPCTACRSLPLLYEKNRRDSWLHRSGGRTVCPPVYSGAEQLYDF